MYSMFYYLATGQLHLHSIPIAYLKMNCVRIRIIRYITLWDTEKEGYDIPSSIKEMKVIGIEMNRLFDKPVLDIKVE